MHTARWEGIHNVVARVVVLKGTYRDSITLMKISNEVSEMAGIRNAAAVMATDLNKRLLSDLGFRTDEIEPAGSNDVIIALDAQDERTLEGAFARVEGLLSAQETMPSEEARPRTLDSGLGLLPDANLVMISVPGEFAKREALKALRKGLHVFLFSSNVDAADELELKQTARDKYLLLMGPDCGTAIINGVVLGFGNVVNRGAVGIVSASGTGLQQVSVLIQREGMGISQAIGTGGNDLSEAIGGIMMMEGIRRVEEDEETKAMVIISKPPNPQTARRVLAFVRRCRKPVVVNFLGQSIDPAEIKGQHQAGTLEDAANIVCSLMQGKKFERKPFSAPGDWVLRVADGEASRLTKTQRYVRGLFSGGTLCYEAMVVMTPLIGEAYSNRPLRAPQRLEDSNISREHTCVDLGSEEFTKGRPHPMIDFKLRKMRILREAGDPETAVILLDVVLGLGSNPDPAAELVPSIVEAKALAQKNGRFLPVVASVIGTPGDPQDLAKQQEELEKAGVVVMPSNAQASRMAALIASKGMGAPGLVGGRKDE
jgi:FdrA protein